MDPQVCVCSARSSLGANRALLPALRRPPAGWGPAPVLARLRFRSPAAALDRNRWCEILGSAQQIQVGKVASYLKLWGIFGGELPSPPLVKIWPLFNSKFPDL